MNDESFERSILEHPAQTLDFIKSILESSTEYSIIAKNLDGTIVLWNEGARRIYGFTPEEVVGKLNGTVLHADPSAAACTQREIIESTLRDGKWEGTLRRRRRNGEEFNARVVTTPRLDASGNPTGILLISKDISGEMRLQTELQRSNDILLQQIAESNRVEAALKLRTTELEQTTSHMSFLSQLAELLHACINMTEARQVVEQKLPQLFQIESGAIYLHCDSSGQVERFASWNGDTRASKESFDPTDCWAIRLTRPHVTRPGDAITRCAHTQGEANHVSICVPLIGQAHSFGFLNLTRLDGDSAAIGREDACLKFAISLADMLAIALSNIRLREMLLEQSIRDPLTQLYNRRYMDDALNREIYRARRAGSSIGVILLDVDNFKEFNDSFGHPAGDQLLRSLGNYLKSHARLEDMVARYGGEEFILVLPGASSEIALARALSLQEGFRMVSSVTHGQIKPPSFSCGVAVFPQHGCSSEEILEQGDRALYRAKELGRNRVVSACQSEGTLLARVRAVSEGR